MTHEMRRLMLFQVSVIATDKMNWVSCPQWIADLCVSFSFYPQNRFVYLVEEGHLIFQGLDCFLRNPALDQAACLCKNLEFYTQTTFKT